MLSSYQISLCAIFLVDRLDTVVDRLDTVSPLETKRLPLACELLLSATTSWDDRGKSD